MQKNKSTERNNKRYKSIIEKFEKSILKNFN